MIDTTMAKVTEVFVIVTLLLLLAGFACKSAFAAPEDWLNKCAPYESTVKDILRSENVDTRFYYLMVAESHCTEKAESEKGAVGFWQMLTVTDRRFGCRDDFNLECQTRAAAKYIKHLHKSFHSFEDVIAAYNMGGHNYKKARAKTSQAIGLIRTVLALESMANTKCAERPSVVVLSAENDCKYWYYMDEPQKFNPCEFAPENAEPAWQEGDEDERR